MLAELAAANAAFAVIKQAISNGRELSGYAHKIGEIVNAKEELQHKVNKKKAAHQTTDFEEFMALERVKEQEEELRQYMIYAGRPGLWADWQKFQRDARVARREAAEAAKRKRKQILEIALASILLILGLGILVFFVIFLIHADARRGG